MMADLIVVVALPVLAGLLVVALASGWPTRQRRFGIASLTAWHDWQPSDKQEATEIVIEERAGKNTYPRGTEEKTEE